MAPACARDPTVTDPREQEQAARRHERFPGNAVPNLRNPLSRLSTQSRAHCAASGTTPSAWSESKRPPSRIGCASNGRDAHVLPRPGRKSREKRAVAVETTVGNRRPRLHRARLARWKRPERRQADAATRWAADRRGAECHSCTVSGWPCCSGGTLRSPAIPMSQRDIATRRPNAERHLHDAGFTVTSVERQIDSIDTLSKRRQRRT